MKLHLHFGPVIKQDICYSHDIASEASACHQAKYLLHVQHPFTWHSITGIKKPLPPWVLQLASSQPVIKQDKCYMYNIPSHDKASQGSKSLRCDGCWFRLLWRRWNDLTLANRSFHNSPVPSTITFPCLWCLLHTFFLLTFFFFHQGINLCIINGIYTRHDHWLQHKLIVSEGSCYRPPWQPLVAPLLALIDLGFL